MKKLIFLFIIFYAFSQIAYSANYSITTSANDTYSPDLLTIHVGDSVTIAASEFHPLVQVDKANWNAEMATPLTGGWGTKVSPYTFIATKLDTIYFCCANHVGLGMRGKIIVQTVANVEDLTTDLFNISVFPNPLSSTGIISINPGIKSNYKINLYDNNGNFVKNIISANISNNTENYIGFDVKEISNGVYTLVVSNEKYLFSKKVIVIK